MLGFFVLIIGMQCGKLAVRKRREDIRRRKSVDRLLLIIVGLYRSSPINAWQDQLSIPLKDSVDIVPVDEMPETLEAGVPEFPEGCLFEVEEGV